MRAIFPFAILVVLFVFTYSTFSVEGTRGIWKTYNNEAREKFLKSKQEGFCDNDNKLLSNEISPNHSSPKKFVRSTDGGAKKFDPNWDSLDARPLPGWYDQSKIGIFIHWGVYSVPGVESEWFWKTWTDGRPECVDFMNNNYKPGFQYQDFGPEFTAEFYDPAKWADLFVKSGAKYVVLTSKHHEGYPLWPSKYSFSWNAGAVGPHRDLLGDFANAIRTNTSLKFGLYHSLYEWYNPLWIQDRDNNHTTTQFVDFKINPEMYDIVNKYHPDIFWSDGEWEAQDTYWNSLEFVAWLYNDSPVKDIVVTNDRWGHNTMCKHGGFYTCADRYNPGVLQPHKWENCLTIDKKSWGYRRNTQLSDYLSPEELMTTIVESVSCRGNVLVNVGPTREGTIPPIQAERLLQMGEWLGVNGEAIYNSIPWLYQNDTVTPGVWFTSSADETKVFAFITNWPGATVQIGAMTSRVGMTVSMLGTPGVLPWVNASPGIQVGLPRLDENASKWVWTLVIEGLGPASEIDNNL